MNKIICPDCGSENKKQEFCSVCNTKLKLNDKYYLIDILGENNQITYLGVDQFDNRVILKELRVDNLENWKTIELFNREISILQEISHNQIPKLLDEFKLDIIGSSSHYLVMEFIDGLTLKEEMNQKRYNEREILEIIKEITQILQYLHSLIPPIIHRDIKLTNIMRRKSDNKLILIDFGAVTDVLKPKGGSTIVGTYGFMAPEQFMGKPTIQSDYYSVGAVAFMLLTHKKLTSDDFVDNSIDISEGSIKKLKVSNNMKAFLSKLLAVKLKDRVKDFNEIFELIENFNNLKFTEKDKVKEIKVKEVKEKEVNKKTINNLDTFTKKYEELVESYNIFIEKPKVKIDVSGREVTSSLYRYLVFIPIIFSIITTSSFLLNFDRKISFILLITISLMYTMFIINYQKYIERNRKLSFINYALSINHIEFVFLFLDNHAPGIVDLELLLGYDVHKYIDKGKMILYKNLLQQMKNKEQK